MQQGVNATGRESCVKILCNAQIASFQPALSYGPVFACVSLRVRVVCTVFFPYVCLCVSIHTMSHHLTYYVTSSYVCAFGFSNVVSFVPLYGICTGALTFENLCDVL